MGSHTDEPATIKKPGTARLSSPHAFRGAVGRALAMIGLLLPLRHIAFVQHSSRELSPALVLMQEIVKINVSKKPHLGMASRDAAASQMRRSSIFLATTNP